MSGEKFRVGDIPLTDEEEIRRSAEQNGHTWGPLDLLALGSESPHPPEVGGLFYRGKRHLLSGEDDAGKTMLLSGVSADELRAGYGVVWSDTDHMGPSALLERLRAFGADDEAIRRLFAYLRPEEALSPEARDDVVALIHDLNARLFIHDAFNPALVLHGYSPTKSDEVEAFWQRAVAPFCNAGAAAILTDHVVKKAEERGRYAYGSERKATGSDLHLGLRVIDAFGRGRQGKARITVHRDRIGFLKRPSPGLFVLDSDPESGRLSWRIEAAHEVSEEGEFRPTRLMARVSDYLFNAGERRSQTQITDDVKGNTDFLRLATDRLVAEGFVSEVAGPNRTRLFGFEEPFLEDE